jgi:hypothetical protein
MANYMRAISAGTVSFDPANNIIIGPITVPCNGTYNGIPYSSKACDGNAVWAWQQAADRIAQQVWHSAPHVLSRQSISPFFFV